MGNNVAAKPMANTKDAAARRAAVDSTKEAASSLTPELVVALCGPIGSPLHEAAEQMAAALAECGYTTEKVRLSDLIRLNAGVVGIAISNDSKFKEIGTLIEAGDALRASFGNDILAKMAIAKVGADRTKRFGEFSDRADEAEKEPTKRIAAHRVCHVIDSIKNKAELDLLRLVYGDALFSIGVFSPLEIRRRNLERPGALSREEVDKLIDTDSGEEFAHGQTVRDTFPRCDFFLRVDHSVVGPSEPKAVGQLVEKLRRFFRLLFRTAVVTPTADEAAMYAAASAAKNSACLSRQVGAAVTGRAGEILAVGWNDVPRFGGGLYGKPTTASAVLPGAAAPEGEADERCFALNGARCQNDQEKSAIAEKVVESLMKSNLLPPARRNEAVGAVLNDTRIKDLIEFSRAVHAEMHAILNASRVAGDRVVGGKIYVTTFPCHSCARHIVVSGIGEVYYIEPYRKSLATRLHSDSLTESAESQDKVRLLQFDGVAPRRFIELFEGGQRKIDGILRLPSRHEAVPSTHVSLRAIPRLEEVVVAEILGTTLKLPGLLPAQGGADEQRPEDKPAA